MRTTALIIILLAFTLPAYSQLNLKGKLEKKADQEIDKFLFGKKKKKGQESGPVSVPDGEGEYESTSGDEGSYVKKDVDFGKVKSDELIHFTTLIDFLPEQIQGYSRSEEPDGSIYKSANFNISTGSKTYSYGDKELTINIFDYKDAAILYTGQASQFQEYESTDGYVKSITVKGHSGWVSEDYDDDDLNLVLAVNDRFIITLDNTGGSAGGIEAIANELNIEQLP